MLRSVVTLSLALLASCTRPVPQAPDFTACEATLAEAFPDTAREAWAIWECGDLGVLAEDETSGDAFAVLPTGDIYHVDHCGWTLLASDVTP